MKHLEHCLKIIDQAISLGFTGDWLYAVPVAVAIATSQKGNMLFAEVKDTEQGRLVCQPYFELDEDSNRFAFKEYHAALMKKILIDHCQVDGIDTKALEDLMQGVDWSIHYKVLEEDIDAMTIHRSKMIAGAQTVLGQLELLSTGSAKGKEIAGLLMVKYFLKTPYEEMAPSDLKDSYFRSRVFHVDGLQAMTQPEAYNILCGRAVRKKYIDTDGKAQIHWFSAPGPEGPDLGYNTMPFFNGQTRYEDYSLSVILGKLPIAIEPDKIAGLLKGLRMGNKESVSIKVDGKLQQMEIWAVPEDKDIGIMDRAGNRITTAELLQMRKQDQAQKGHQANHKNGKNRI